MAILSGSQHKRITMKNILFFFTIVAIYKYQPFFTISYCHTINTPKQQDKMYC